MFMLNNHENPAAIEKIQQLEKKIELLEQKYSAIKEKYDQQIENSNQLVDNTRDGILQINNYGEIEFLNPAFERISGYQKSELIKKSLEAMKLFDFDLNMITATTGASLELLLNCKDNSRKEVILSINPIKSEGLVDSLVCIVHDVSEHYKNERLVQNIIKGLSSATGIDFFKSLVKYFAEALAVDFAGIVKLSPKDLDSPETVATHHSGMNNPGTFTQINETPLEKVIAHHFFYVPEKITGLFPRIRAWISTPVDNFMGILLEDTTGNYLGILYIINHEPLKNPQLADSLLRLFALRAATELERQTREKDLKRLAFFTNQSPNLIVEFLNNGEISYFNPALQKEIDEKRINQPAELLPDNYKNLVRQCLSESRKLYLEIQRKRRIYQWEFYPIADGNVVHAIGIDLTNLKKAEEKYSHLVEKLEEGLCIVDFNDHFLFVNQSAAAIMGYTVDDVRRMTLRDLADRENYAIIKHEAEKRKKGISSKYQLKLIKKDNSICYVKVSATPYYDEETNKIIATLALFQDITDQVIAAEQLSMQQAYFEQLFQNSPLGIALVDQQGSVKTINPGFEKLFAYCQEELQNKSLVNILIADENETIRREINDALQKQKTIEKELQCLPKSMIKMDVLLIAFPIVYKQQVLGSYFILSNISPLQNALRDLKMSYNELLVANKIQKDILNLVSHELKTPLVVMIGNTEILMDYGESIERPQQLQILKTIIQNGRRQNEIIDDLLTASSLEMNKLNAKLEPVNLSSILEPIILTRKNEAISKRITILNHLGHSLPPVWGDPLLLKRVFNNLLSNAIKFSPIGNKVEIFADLNEKEVKVSISDNGIGIPEDKLEAIFEKFYQIEDATNRQYGGIGLGLYIVRDLLNLQNARITVDSEVGKGSCFNVFLHHAKNPTQVLF